MTKKRKFVLAEVSLAHLAPEITPGQSGGEGVITIEPVPATLSGLSIIVNNHPVPAHGLGSGAYCGIGTLHTRFCYLHAAGNVSRHDITARFIEDGLGDAWVGSAESLPVSKGRVCSGDVTIANCYRFQWNLRLARVEGILGHNLSSQGWNVMSLFNISTYSK